MTTTRGALAGPRVLLRKLREVMAEPIGAQERLDKIVRLIASNMVAEVCSIYVLRADNVLELFATEGLQPGAVHRATLTVGRGLVGLIAEDARPLNLPDAQSHPAFAYLPETGEEIYHSFGTPGDHAVEFELDEDDLLVDNSRFLRVHVRDSLPVLVVDGDPGGDELGGEVGDLLLVLDPLFNRTGNDGYRRYFDPTWVSHHEFNRGELSLGDYECVLIANVREIDEARVTELENYVRRGGGVWFFLGDRVLPESYNQRMYRADGSGLLPMPLRNEAVGELTTVTGDPSSTRFFRMQVSDELHPMIRTFVDDRRRRYLASPVTRYLPFQTVEKLPASVRVPVRFDVNDEPALVDHALGTGHVVWFVTSADSKDNWSLFVTNTNAMFPLIWDVASYLVLRDPGTHLLPIGGAIRKSVPLAPSPYTVTRPDGEIRRITALPTEPVLGHFPLPPFSDTGIPGMYALDLPIGNGPPVLELFAVNVDPTEGQLESLDREQLTQLLDPDLFLYDTEIVQGDVQEVSQKQGEIWKTLISILLAMLVLETLLAWRFGAYS